MNVLGIDTGGRFGGVAVVDDDGIRGELRLKGIRDYAERLTPWIDNLLDQIGLGPEELDTVAVAVGPGSFTGVRVGVATAQGMAVALRIPVVPVDSLKACAFATGPTDRPVAVVLDAGRGEVYGGVYGWTPIGPVVLVEPELSRPEEFLNRLEPPLHLTGSGLPTVRQAAEKLLGGEVEFPDAGWYGSPPWAVAALGLIYFGKDGGISPGELEPVYIRPPAARLPDKTRRKK